MADDDTETSDEPTEESTDDDDDSEDQSFRERVEEIRGRPSWHSHGN